MSTNINETRGELPLSAGAETSNFDHLAMGEANEGIVKPNAATDHSSKKGVPETFLAPTPKNRYETWLDETTEEERKQREFDDWKSEFDARTQGKEGSQPTLEEQLDCAFRRLERNRIMSQAKEMNETYSKEFKVTSLPKDTLDALELFSQMRPLGFTVTRPKDYRDGIPLAAPGGVVDEEELDTDALHIQQFMMAAKKQAMEEEEGKSNKNTLSRRTNAGGKKKMKKKGQGQGQDKNIGNNSTNSDISSTGSINEAHEDGMNPRIIPIEDTIWYSPPHFPRLARALVQAASQLEKRIGTERAIAALHTALTDEALKAETAYLTLQAEAEYYRSRIRDKPNGSINHEVVRKSSTYMERADMLRQDKASLKSLKGKDLHSVLHDHSKTRAVLLELCENGDTTPELYATLGCYFLEGFGGPADGKKAEYYLRLSHFDESDDVYRAVLILRSRLFSYGLGPIKPDLVTAFNLMRQAIEISDQLDRHLEWCDFFALARGFRWGLGANIDHAQALRYYNRILGAYLSSSKVSSIAKPYLPQMVREAKQYKEMIKKIGKDGLLCDPQEREIRFKHLSESLQNKHKEEKTSYDHKLSRVYLDEQGKLVLPKGFVALEPQRFTLPVTMSAYDKTLMYGEQKNYPEMLKSLAQAESNSGTLSSEQRRNLYLLALNYYSEKIVEGENVGEMFHKYSDKLILEKEPWGWYKKGQAYFDFPDPKFKPDIDKAIRCYVNAEKLALASPERDDELLGYIYYDMGCCYMKEVPINNGMKNGSQPLDAAKGIMYLRKAIKLGNTSARLSFSQHYHRANAHFNHQGIPGEIPYEVYKGAREALKDLLPDRKD